MLYFGDMPDYIIKEGNHRSSPKIRGLNLFSKGVDYTVCFDESFLYELKRDADNDQLDINKLPGYTRGFRGPRGNSARLGVRRPDITNQKIELLTYTYRKGKSSYKHLCFVEPGQYFTYKILQKSYGDEFYVDGKLLYTEGNDAIRLGIKTGVYFGGDRVAPHDIKIKLINNAK